MYCPNCGQPIADGAVFCGNCGASLAPSPKPKKKLRWLLPAILGLLLAGGVTVFLLWFFGDARAYQQAQKLYQQGEYIQAENAFRKLGDYEDSAQQVQACRYHQALGFFDQGQYELAEQIFLSLNGFSDSAEQIRACRYQRARAAFDKEDLETAEALFAELGDYKDSADWLAKCRSANPVGIWDLSHFYSEGTDYAELLKQMGESAYLVLEEGGTGYIFLIDERVDLTWTEDRLLMESGEVMAYVLDGDTLSIEDGDDTLVFSRTSTVPAPEPAPAGSGGGGAGGQEDQDLRPLSGNLYWKLDRGVLTISGLGSMDTGFDYDEFPWFEDRDSITRVEIRDGVTSIESNAFYDCENLVSVSIPSSVARIGDYAFEDCYSLTSVVIPEGVVYLGDMVFDCCRSMESLSLPASLSELGYLCFSSCSELKELRLAAGSKTFALVDNVLFTKDMKTLVLYPPARPGGSYTVPEGVAVVGGGAFDSNRYLTELNLPSGLEELGSWAFASVEQLAVIWLPDGLRNINGYCFAFGTGLREIWIPDSVERIGYYAFEYCPGLTIYYAGSPEQWEAVEFDNDEDVNPDATLCFYAR